MLHKLGVVRTVHQWQQDQDRDKATLEHFVYSLQPKHAYYSCRSVVSKFTPQQLNIQSKFGGAVEQ